MTVFCANLAFVHDLQLLGISSDNAATLLFSHVTTSSLVMPLSLSPSHTTEFVKLLLDVTLFSEKLLFL